MEKYIIAAFVLLTVAAVVLLWIYSKKRIRPEKIKEKFPDIMPLKDSEMALASDRRLSLCFNELSALSEEDEMRIAEIKDKNLLAQIDNVIPRAVQAVANAAAVNDYQNKANAVGVLYQAIIPKGAVLAESRAMDGAVRGIFHGKNGISGHANLVAVNSDIGGNLAAVNVANAAMGVASMVVGQYYMTQINDKLKSVNDKIDKLYKFQDNEFKSKVYALVAEIQKMAVFQYEIMTRNELRKRELAHLKNLEHQCAELLGQANLTIQDHISDNESNYSDYEDAICDIDHWFKYQQTLLEILYRISELTYAMNMGTISRENSESLYLSYSKQTDDVLGKLRSWHKNNISRLGVDVSHKRIKRRGVEGAIMNVPSLINSDLKYKRISGQTVDMIKTQSNSNTKIKQDEDRDLYNEDVRLIKKDGKVYYLPPEKKVEVE